MPLVSPHLRSFALAIVAFASGVAAPAAVGQSVEPPVAAQQPVTLEMHDHTRVDPYFWLRERENPEVIRYLEGENAYFEAHMAPLEPLREELFEEIKGRIKQDDSSVPYRLGDHYYYYRYEEGGQYPIYARKAGSLDGDEQILLDMNALGEQHAFYSAFASYQSVSPSGRYLAWAADTTGRRFYTIRILDMESGEMLDDAIADVTGNLAWSEDDRTIFYARQHPETLRSYRIYRHRLGTDQADDVLVYEEADDTFRTFVTKTNDRSHLLIGSSQTLATEWRILEADNPQGTFRVFAPRERGHEYDVEHAGDHFYIRTNRDAQNFRLMRTPEDATGKEHWEEVIAHRDDVFLSNFEPFEDFLVVNERRDGLNHIRIRPWEDPATEHYVPFDDPAYAVYLGTNPNFDSSVLRYVYESPASPQTTYDYDVFTREETVVKREEVLGGFDGEAYAVERLTVPARDGALVPATVVYRKDRFERDGSNPLFLYGYGSYGASIQPSFNAARMSLLDRGFVFAIAHIRGSETLGRRWYEDGKLLKKKNTFTDFIDVAEHLAGEGYGDRERLYAMGGSAGGLLMGAVMNMRPDLFHGIIAHVPWVDVVTTMLDDSIPLTTNEYDEWGNPNDPEYYRYMLSYSPYDNIEAKAYPNLLVTTGLHDSQVQYWEPAKWVAKLRATKTDDNLILMHTNMAAGHGGASGRLDGYQETARDYAFLLHLAGAVSLSGPER